MNQVGNSLTREQVHQLVHETTVLLAMATQPHLHTAADACEQAQRAYTLSPPYALVVLASAGAGRFWRMSRHEDDDDGASEVARFPRDVLQTVPSDGRPDLLFLAIDLIETVARHGRVRPLVDQLLVDGIRSYHLLLSVAHELGWLAAQADPELKTVVQLAEQEAVTAEQDWYDSQQAL